MRLAFRLIAVVILLSLPAIGYLAYSSYFGQYYFVAATRGSRNELQHEENLRTALACDPTIGYADFLLARLDVRRGYYGAALPHQEKGMRSFSSLGGYKQLGTILDRLGQTDKADTVYQKVLRMHPNDIETLERLAKLAYEAGEHDRVADLTAEILRLDMVNTNAYFLRARDAELVSNWSAAYMNYQRLATIIARQPTAQDRAFFDKEDVASRMHEISKLLVPK